MKTYLVMKYRRIAYYGSLELASVDSVFSNYEDAKNYANNKNARAQYQRYKVSARKVTGATV